VVGLRQGKMGKKGAKTSILKIEGLRASNMSSNVFSKQYAR
jgi:hypothetical protein